MNSQLDAINLHLPRDLSLLALDFLKVHVIRCQPLLCPLCGVNPAEYNGGPWKDVYHCYDCRASMIGRAPHVGSDGRRVVRILISECPLTLVDVHVQFFDEEWEFPPDWGDEDANGFPFQFVRSDELYWGPAAPGFR